jgi:Glu-tRNA(Gln) amidotransferase subunit E-like FAD-binding protein
MLKSIQAVALAKAVKDEDKKAASGELGAGKYEGEFLAKVSYKLNKGEDYDQRITAKADPWTLLAVALSKLNGVTVDALVKEAVNGDIDLTEIKARADAAMAEVKGPTMTRCNGKVSGKVEVEIIPTAQVKIE